MLDPSREAAATLKDLKTMTIAATLNYQACDDKLVSTRRPCHSPGR
jgi:hypothetical protein